MDHPADFPRDAGTALGQGVALKVEGNGSYKNKNHRYQL